MFSATLFWLLIILVTFIVDADLTLYNYLFKNYRKEIRPMNPQHPASTNVTVQLFLKQIQKVKESDQTLSLYCWIEMYWTDFYLKWNEKEFNGTKEIIVPVSEIWKPDLLVYNNAHMNVEANQLETNAVIKSDGRVSVYRAMVTQITCLLNLDDFPFDQQICYIMLSSWSYDGSGIMLDTLVNTLVDNSQTDLAKISTLTHYMENSEWQLNDFKIRRNLKYYECCPYAFPDLTYYFSIRRNPMYYLFTQLLPSSFISVITIIGSFTPHHTTGENQEKITLGATAGMAIVIILMMIADKLPATSNTLPLLGKFYVGLIFIIFFGTSCTTVVMSIQMKGNLGKPIPEWLRSLIRNSRILRYIFKNINTKRNMKKRCTCGTRRSSSFFLKTENGGCKWLIPSHTTPEAYSSLTPPYQRILSIMGDIRCSSEATAQRLYHEQMVQECRREWEYIARGLDRVFLCFFVTITVVYELWLLSLTNITPLKISDEFMNLTAGLS
ncbi:unnamed protein product [Bursaphelenchus okinawaensis]|uniref:Uncharacterized protein n=1 Tax=Bursaphelenchus okinawaensis TaxID=465554 RepID=A0A811KTM4_9BILA|nr:unnamed protein product [Bursaphelenchus okinawaensis]CAG9112573.1 unnamed protein product [Bursaphelenchus okinawaensis]